MLNSTEIQELSREARFDIDGDGYIIAKPTETIQQKPEFISQNNPNRLNAFKSDDGILITTNEVTDQAAAGAPGLLTGLSRNNPHVFPPVAFLTPGAEDKVQLNFMGYTDAQVFLSPVTSPLELQPHLASQFEVVSDKGGKIPATIIMGMGLQGIEITVPGLSQKAPDETLYVHYKPETLSGAIFSMNDPASFISTGEFMFEINTVEFDKAYTGLPGQGLPPPSREPRRSWSTAARRRV